METISLAGIWNQNIKLPGSTCENGIGKKQEYYDSYAKEALRAPRERYEYIGEFVYEREIDIPSEWEDKEIYLFLERVNISSKVFIDGFQIGRGIIELSTPHIYRLTGRLDENNKPFNPVTAGKHVLKIVVDNSDILHLGDMASGYSVDTGGYWNGIIGRIELIAKEKCHVESVAVYTKRDSITVKTVTISDVYIPMANKNATLSYVVFDENDEPLYEGSEAIELFSRRQRTSYTINNLKLKCWDEFDPILYKIRVTLQVDDITSSKEETFGYRWVSVKDKEFNINDEPLSLRGTINCAQYPITGYPPMDEETWVKHFNKLKEFGLNHVRFHAWCPPEAAFLAADKLGMYLAIEMPLWLNRDVTPYEFMDDEWAEQYFRTEALRISETYGNHPSFVFFSNGNENMGDFALLETIIKETKAIDDRRLYTMTSNFDHPKSEAEDYLCAFEILHHKARIQFLHDEVAKSTTVNYDVAREDVPAPFTSFEVGQYCVYPDVDVCEKYTGAMLPVNFDLIRKLMKEKGVYDRLHDYIKASGDLAWKLYKEDIEAVLRTKKMGGFQLLSISDYTGQSTATIGMLDVFLEEKGIVNKEVWRGFCSETVPLFEAKRIFSNKEKLEADLALYDYSKYRNNGSVFNVKIMDGKKVFYEASVTKISEKEHISVDLSGITKNTLLKVYVSVKRGKQTYTNSWRIFVFADLKEMEINKPADLFSIEDIERVKKEGGEHVAGISLISKYLNKETMKNSFVPVFWSPVHFPSSAPCGAMIDIKSEALTNLPTEEYPDYQWKNYLDNSVSMDIRGIEDIEPVIEMVPNFVDNVRKSPFFYIKLGSARILARQEFDFDPF